VTDSYGTTTYAYDPAGRVVKVVAPGKTTSYMYDRSGNRISQSEAYLSPQFSGYTDPETGVDVQYTAKRSEYLYSNSNELLRLTERMLDEYGEELLQKTTTYRYDANGNEIRQMVIYIQPHTASKRQSTGAVPYGDTIDYDISSVIEKVSSEYDGFNRLVYRETVKQGVRSIVTFTYDGDDLRTEKRSRSSDRDYEEEVVRYVYDRQYVILELDAEGEAVTRYVRGDRYIARIDVTSQSAAYYFYNGHAYVVQTVTESGEQLNAYEYDIFGNPILTIETHANAIRYSGEFYDAETGLYYLRARYYAPYIGRFITEDTYKGDILNPLSLNLYTYVHNDPINFWDPTGHWEQGDEKLNVEDQSRIIALTNAYFKAQTSEERQAIHKLATEIREKAKEAQKQGTYNANVITPLQFQQQAIVQTVNQAVAKRGYMTQSEWESALKKADIQVSTTSSSSGADSTTDWIRTETVTTIGRTLLTVDSKYTLDYKSPTASASLNIAYKVTENETKFIVSMADDELKLEQILVLYDTIKANNGKLTKEGLASAGIKYQPGFLGTRFGDNISSIEMVYDFSQKGLTLYEAELMYQQAQETFTNALGLVAFRSLSGGGYKLQPNKSQVASVKVSQPASNNITSGKSNSTKVTTQNNTNTNKNTQTNNTSKANTPSTTTNQTNQANNNKSNGNQYLDKPTAGDNKGSSLRTQGTGKASKWVDEAGNIKWPPNDGFAGKPNNVTLKPGTQIDRYGYESGSFASPVGTPYNQRSLAPGTENKPYHVYEVVKPIEAQGGKIAPWFDQPGGRTQYKFNMSIEDLIKGGYIREVKK